MSESSIPEQNDPKRRSRIRGFIGRLLEEKTLPGVIDGHGSVEGGDPGDARIIDGQEPEELPEIEEVEESGSE